MTANTSASDGEGSDLAQTFAVGDPATNGRIIQPGTVLDDKYLVQEMLGRGGMGCVFRARHTIMQKDYAVKVLSSSRMDGDSMRRFTVEGRVIARLDHPAIVKVHNMGIDGGDCPFYVMDLLPGVPLSEVCGAKWLGPMSDILKLFRDLAHGLAYAHSKGVIHRDIKPSNIIILAGTEDGIKAKIVDFGIAKVQQSAIDGQAQTLVGEIFGSPLYMSPEQSLGQPCDERTDIYSLGCTLFEVLTGVPPFCGVSAMDTLMMHQSLTAPRLRQVAPAANFSDALELVLAKMLEKDAGLRYQSMQQLMHDLDRIVEGKSVGKSALVQRDVGSDEEAKADRPWNEIQGLGTLAVALVATLIIVGGAFLLWPQFGGHTTQKTIKEATKGDMPPSAAVVASTQPGSAATDDAAKEAAVVDKQFAEAAKIDPFDPSQVAVLERVKTIRSSLVSEKGGPGRRLVLPQVPIGEVIAGEYKIKPKNGTGSREYEWPASNTEVMLFVNTPNNFVAYFNPNIYKKIGKNEFTGLHITGQLPESLIDKYPKNAKDPSVYIADIMHTASGWSRVNQLVLEYLDLNNSAIQKEFSRFTHLRRLDLVKMPNLPMAFLRESPVLKSLDEFFMQASGPPGPLIDRLLPDGTLTKLYIDGVYMNTQLAEKLQKYNKLDTLELRNAIPPDNIVDAVAQIKSLKRLSFSHAFISDAKIARLCAHKNITQLILDYESYSEQAQARLRSSRVRFE